MPASTTDVASADVTPADAATIPPPALAAPEDSRAQSFDEWLADGRQALESGDHEVALTAFSKALEIDPHSAEAHHSRGTTYFRTSQLAAAVRDFSKAIELVPDTPLYYASRARAYRTQADHHRAIADLTAAIQIEPAVANWYRERANVYVLMKEKRLALRDVATADRLEEPSAVPAQLPGNVGAAVPGDQSDSADVRTRFEPLRELAEDLHELTRLSDAALADLKLLLGEYEQQLNEVRRKLDETRPDPTYAAYAAAHRLYGDSARIWEVQKKAKHLLESAKDKNRQEITIRAIAKGEGADRSDLVDALAAYQFIIEQGHAVNTLYPLSSKLTNDLTDVQLRHPELAGDDRGFSYIKNGAVHHLWEKAENALAPLWPNRLVESPPAYGRSKEKRSVRLAARTTDIRAAAGDTDDDLSDEEKRMRVIFQDWAVRHREARNKADKMAQRLRDTYMSRMDKVLQESLTAKYDIDADELERIKALGIERNWW